MGIESLDSAISSRINGKADNEEFYQMVSLGLTKGGNDGTADIGTVVLLFRPAQS